MLVTVTDFVGISVASASRIIKLVTAAIAFLRVDLFQMPQNREEMVIVAEELYTKTRFRNAVE